MRYKTGMPSSLPLRALNSRALPLGSKKNIVHCSPGWPAGAAGTRQGVGLGRRRAAQGLQGVRRAYHRSAPRLPLPPHRSGSAAAARPGRPSRRGRRRRGTHSPWKRRCGSMTNSTRPCSRWASSLKSSTESATPKCGTGTGSPSTAGGRRGVCISPLPSDMQPRVWGGRGHAESRPLWAAWACVAQGERRGLGWTHPRCGTEPRCTRPRGAPPPAGYRAGLSSAGCPARVQPAVHRAWERQAVCCPCSALRSRRRCRRPRT